MFSNTKRLGAVAVILGVINIVMGIITTVYLNSMLLTFYQVFAAAAYILTTSVAFLVLGAALFSLGDDLNVTTDANANEVAKLKKRVDRLENMQ